MEPGEKEQNAEISLFINQVEEEKLSYAKYPVMDNSKPISLFAESSSTISDFNAQHRVKHVMVSEKFREQNEKLFNNHCSNRTNALLEISEIEKKIRESERNTESSSIRIKNLNEEVLNLERNVQENNLLIEKTNGEITRENKMILELKKEINRSYEDLSNIKDMMAEKKFDIQKKKLEFQEINRKKREMIENEIKVVEKTNLEIKHNLKSKAEGMSYNPESPSSKSLTRQKFIPSVMPQESEEVSSLLLKIQSLEYEIATETEFLNNHEQDSYEKSIKLQNPADSSISFWTLFLFCALGVLTMMVLSSIH